MVDLMGDTNVCDCKCHTGLYAACDQPGGCGTQHRTTNATGEYQHTTGTCHAGTGCRDYDPVRKRSADTHQPLCDPDLERAERDTRALVYDYLDLAQLHQASMSQAISEKTAGSKEKTMLLVAHVEALQAEIVHVTITWEYEVRVAARLSDPLVKAPVADWHTTISRPTPLAKVRPGAAVQRAIGILGPRMRILAQLPPTAVCPTGVEDDPTDLYGWEAALHLSTLHARAKAALGRTTRTFWIPGECWACNARPTPGETGPLYRSEPRHREDPMQVSCTACAAQRPYADYETYMGTLLWPNAPTDSNVRIAA